MRLSDPLINAKVISIVCDYSLSYSKKIISKLIKDIKIDTGKKTRQGKVPASEASERLYVSINDLINVHYELYPIKNHIKEKESAGTDSI